MDDSKSVYHYLETSGLLNSLMKRTPSTNNKSQSRNPLLSVQRNNGADSFRKPPRSAARPNFRPTFAPNVSKPDASRIQMLKKTDRSTSAFNLSKLNESINTDNISITSTVKKSDNDKLKSSLRKNKPLSVSLMNLHSSVKKSVTFNEDVLEKIDEHQHQQPEEEQEQSSPNSDLDQTIVSSTTVLKSENELSKVQDKKLLPQFEITETTTKYLLTPVKTVKVHTLTPLSGRKKLIKTTKTTSLNTSDIAFMTDELLCSDTDVIDQKLPISFPKTDDKKMEPIVFENKMQSEMENRYQTLDKNNKLIQKYTEMIRNITEENQKILSEIESCQQNGRLVDVNIKPIQQDEVDLKCEKSEYPFKMLKSLQELEVKSNDNDVDVDVDSDNDNNLSDGDKKDDDSFLNCFGKLQLNDKSLNEYNLMRANLIHLKSPKLLKHGSVKRSIIENSPDERLSIRVQKQLLKMYDKSMLASDCSSDRENES